MYPHAVEPRACHGDYHNQQHGNQCCEDRIFNERRATLVAPNTLEHRDTPNTHLLPASHQRADLEPAPLSLMPRLGWTNVAQSAQPTAASLLRIASAIGAIGATPTSFLLNW
jgi:hypothetical protein